MVGISGRLLAGVAVSALFAIGCGGDNGGAGGRSGSGGAGRGGTTGHAGTGGGGTGGGGTTGSAGTGGAAGTVGSGGGGTGGAGTTGSAGTGGAAGTAGSGGGGTGGGGTTGNAGTSGTTSINCGGRAAWLGDFDGDGVADCARAQAGAGTQLDLVFNKGVSSGLYLAAAVITPDVVAPDYLTGSAPALVSDLNHDSRQDIVIEINFPGANPSTVIQSYLQFFRGHADGTFDRHDPSFNFVIGDVISWQPAFADFDGDGFADTIAASAQWSLYSDFYFYVLKSTGGSDFRVAAGGGIHALRGTAGVIRAADLNGDGKLDLVVHAVPNPAAMTLGMPSYLAVALAVSDASFSEAVRISGTDGATTAQVSDVNTDGKPDLLVTLPAGQTPFYGNGAGQFSATAP